MISEEEKEEKPAANISSRPKRKRTKPVNYSNEFDQLDSYNKGMHTLVSSSIFTIFIHIKMTT